MVVVPQCLPQFPLCLLPWEPPTPALLLPAVTTVPSRCRQGPADARGTASDFCPYPTCPSGVGAWREKVEDPLRKEGWRRRWEVGGGVDSPY